MALEKCEQSVNENPWRLHLFSLILGRLLIIVKDKLTGYNGGISPSQYKRLLHVRLFVSGAYPVLIPSFLSKVR